MAEQAAEKPVAVEIPSPEQVEAELEKIRYRRRFGRTLLQTAAVLVVVAAAAVLISTIFMPVIQVSGGSMSPTLNDGDVLVTLNTKRISYGDLCCVSWQNKMLLKRVIGLSGDTVSIAEDGSVTVNGVLLDEPYVIEKSLGQCDITFPYVVPEDKIFLLGDNRLLSADSRSADIGCIGHDQIIGKVLFRIWEKKS
ncbi:MAG: signal peptidase I [Oscillospiraceae bacterium]|nr:signal peptidase I [Oscillospiraceae bacterium]